MICPRCKKEIVDVVEHEFCVYHQYAPTSITEELILDSDDIQPPHRPKKELVPKQLPISHNLADLHAKPPIFIHKYNEDEFVVDSMEDFARKTFEDME